MPLVHRPAIGSLLLTALRRGRGLEQDDLALMANRPKAQITAWENGEEPSWPTLVELCVDRLKYDLAELEALYDSLARIDGLNARDGARPAIPPSPIPITDGELREIRRVTGPLGRATMDAHADFAAREIRARKVRQARKEADALCTAYFAQPPARRNPFGLGAVGGALLWAVAENLAERSAKAAAHSYKEALVIARLACQAARLAPGDEAWRMRLLGFCLAFLANAWRVAGKIKRAERIFRCALDLWNRGEAGDPDRILPAWRLFDLEASLRRDARDFPAALALHERAKEAAPEAAWGHILLNRAFTLDAMFDPEPALAVLQEAGPRLGAGTDPRLRGVALSLECSNLCRLARYSEAERALHAAVRVATELGNELDLVRLRGLRGRVEAGLGRTAAALESFQVARRHFDRERMAYDYALGSLEEAELRLRLGQFDRVQRMVTRDMGWVFTSEGIHVEARAALLLFREAVEGDAATAELARRIHHYLERAAHDPALRFDA